MKITNEDIKRVKNFYNQKRVFRQLKTMVSFLIPHRSDVKLILSLGGDSYTDGNTITIGLPQIFVKKSYEEIFTALRAIVGHEAQHVNSSDFKGFVQFQKDVVAYFASRYPELSNSRSQKQVQKIAKSFLNIVEDGRIEKILGNKLPGYVKYLKYLNLTIWDHQEIQGNSEMEDFMGGLWSHAKLGVEAKKFGDFHVDTDVRKTLDAIIPFIHEGVDARTAQAGIDATWKIVKESESFISRLLIQNAQDTQEAISNMSDMNEFSTSEESQYNDSDESSTVHIKPRKKKQEEKKDDDSSKKDEKKAKGQSKEKDTGDEEESDEKKASSKDEEQASEEEQKSSTGSTDEEEGEEGEEEGTSSSSSSDNTEEDETKSSGGDGDEDEEENDSTEQTEDEDDSDSQGSGESYADSDDAEKEEGEGDTDNSSDGDSDGEEEAGDAGDSSDSDSKGEEESQEDADEEEGGDGQEKSKLPETAEEEIPEENAKADHNPQGMDNDEELFDEEKAREFLEALTKEVIEEAEKKLDGINHKDNSTLNPDDFRLDENEIREVEALYRNDTHGRFYEEQNLVLRHTITTELKREGSRFRKEVERIFRNKEEYTLRGQRRGKLDVGNLHKLQARDFNVMVKKNVPVQSDYVAFLLEDGSGSMTENNKFKSSKEAIAVMEEGLKGIIPFKIATFNTSYSAHATVHNVVKGFNEDNRSYNYAYNALMQRKAGGGNKDGMSIRIATKELLKRPERDRILIVFSDGLPSDYRGGQKEGMVDVKNAIKDARKAGIFVVALLFGNESFRDLNIENYRYMYEKNIISCEPQMISKQLTKMLKKIIAH